MKQPSSLDSESVNYEGLPTGPIAPDANKLVIMRRSDPGYCYEVCESSTVLEIRTMTGCSTQTLPSAFPTCLPTISIRNAARVTSAMRYLDLVVLCYAASADE